MPSRIKFFDYGKASGFPVHIAQYESVTGKGKVLRPKCDFRIEPQ